MNIKKIKISIILLMSLFLVGLSPVFAADEKSSKDKPCKLATSPAECHYQPLGCEDKNAKEIKGTPRNCLFLEEPIGGKKGWDLYTVDCKKETVDKKEINVCTYKLWRGGAITGKTEGPFQALLTEDKSKPY